MMRVYLAAPYAARALIFEYARDLCRLDLDVTASWINEEHEINDGTTGAATALSDEEVARHAATDLDDIDRCDVLVLFTSASVGFPEAKSGGRHVEFGYALAKGKPVIVVGEPENVFHRLGGLVTFAGDVEVVLNWMAAIGALVGERDGGRSA